MGGCKLDEYGVARLLFITKANLDGERMAEVLRAMWEAGYNAGTEAADEGYISPSGIVMKSIAEKQQQHEASST